MQQPIRLVLALFALFTSSSLRGTDSWAMLKVGMTSDEAAETLGEPLIKTIGRGFELWIYDNNAEAVFFGGPLVGWTTPSENKTPVRVVDVWQHKPGDPAVPTFILPRATKRIVRRIPVSAENNSGTSLYRLAK